jgi:AhpD family alkylhydroperoxidase
VYLLAFKSVYRGGKEKTMKLDEHFMRLIAVGASVAANCQPCLEINLARAKECGADETELTQAIWVGRMVRRGAASKMDDFTSNLVQPATVPTPATEADCGCG